VHAGTIRGLHLQRPPAAECKLVRVTAGAIHDVILDVRAGSETFGQWFATVLSADNRAMLYIPQGFAHGFQTLVPGSEVTYHISCGYAPAHAAGIAYNDPDLGIAWPLPPPVIISERDAAWPRLRDFKPISLS
jgi:dTDP-4-dehydrorhamnose 3,5-epimerase